MGQLSPSGKCRTKELEDTLDDGSLPSPDGCRELVAGRGEPASERKMPKDWDVIVVGSGNAALCAAIAAKEKGRDVLVIEKAQPDLAGGNSKYTAGAMRFVYNTKEELLPLLQDPERSEAAEHGFRQLHGPEVRGRPSRLQ